MEKIKNIRAVGRGQKMTFHTNHKRLRQRFRGTRSFAIHNIKAKNKLCAPLSPNTMSALDQLELIKLGDLCQKRHLVSVYEDATIGDALETMKKHGVTSVAVINQAKKQVIAVADIRMLMFYLAWYSFLLFLVILAVFIYIISGANTSMILPVPSLSLMTSSTIKTPRLPRHSTHNRKALACGLISTLSPSSA